MGNRCVITTEYNFSNNGVGVYLHWNGGRDSVQAFLTYCKIKGFRTPDTDCYGWARLAQVCANFFGGSMSIGIDTVDNLDCDNGDNGVYIIEGWDIVDRKYFDWSEQNEYDLDEMLIAIDESMPENEQIGKEYLMAPVIKPKDMKIGDTIAFMDFNGMIKEKVIGIGQDRMVNGTNVKGFPYIGKYGSPFCSPENNINNYLPDIREYRKLS